MSALHTRMRNAGWILLPLGEGRWRLTAPDGNTWEDHADNLTPKIPAITQHLEADEAAIAAGTRTPFLGTARLTAPPLDGYPTLLAEWIAQQHIPRGHAVLRLLTAPDPAGTDLLHQAGAWRVDTLLPPWTPPSLPGDTHPFHVILCEHVIDVLPRIDRTQVLQTIAKILPKDGEAWFSLFQMSAMPPDALKHPHEDGYTLAYGRHTVFLRPHTPTMAQREITEFLGGTLEIAATRHHELICCWRPHA